MKRTLLLSVVASTMIMAGGDIAPVEPVVVEPVEVSGWEFNGQAVAYTQTKDNYGNGDLFGGDSTSGALGLQLGALNKDIFWGIGAGFEVSVLANGYNNNYSNSNFGLQDDEALTQAYLTYGLGNTTLKVGRQQLPKALSPFAFTEGWQIFKNTMDAALIVNTDITDTVLVGAYVTKSNGSTGSLNNFTKINELGDGVYMATIANKSIDKLTLTGTWYYAPDMLAVEDVNVLWGDAKYGFGADMYGLVLGVQGGVVMGVDDLNIAGASDTTAFGAKIGGNFEYFDASIAYSSVDDGVVPIHNLATGVKTPLYTQLILNQNAIKSDSDTIVVKAGIKGLGGKFGVAYNYSDMGPAAMASTFGQGVAGEGEYTELDLTYKTKVLNDSTTLFAGYVYQTDDRQVDETQNFVRFWARYNF